VELSHRTVQERVSTSTISPQKIDFRFDRTKHMPISIIEHFPFDAGDLVA
jgi:hypothetical protein